MPQGKTLLGATVTDMYYNLCYSSWTGYGERFETYPEAFWAAVEFFEKTPWIEKVVIETRVFFRYAEAADTVALGSNQAIESETLTRSEAERRAQYTSKKTTAV